MQHLKRLGYFFLVLAVWGCLSPIQTFQLQEDVREIGIHLAKDGESATCLVLESSQWTHECHSCLASHLGASVDLALEKTRVADLFRKGHRVPIPQMRLVARRLASPNKRSPPSV